MGTADDDVVLSRHDLHVLANANDAIIRTSEQFLALLGPSPFPELKLQTLENVAPVFRHPAETLVKQIAVLIEKLESRDDFDETARKIANRLGECASGIRGAISVFGLSSPERLAEYTNLTIHVLEKFDQIIALPKEPLRAVRRSARDLGRIIYIHSLQRQTALLHHHAPLLRDHLSPNRMNGAVRQAIDGPIPLAKAISQAVDTVQPLAHARGVRIDRPRSIPDVKLAIPSSLAVRGLKNLLENAAKYTGVLPADSQYPEPWIVLRIKDSTTSTCLEIESWGAPVTHEEHAGQLYLKRGYRGYFAHKLGIGGSGAGLAEAKEIFEKYGGTIAVETRPVDKYYSTEKSVKFTVSVQFPKD